MVSLPQFTYTWILQTIFWVYFALDGDCLPLANISISYSIHFMVWYLMYKCHICLFAIFQHENTSFSNCECKALTVWHFHHISRCCIPDDIWYIALRPDSLFSVHCCLLQQFTVTEGSFDYHIALIALTLSYHVHNVWNILSVIAFRAHYFLKHGRIHRIFLF